jgi:hypothetical protein
VLFLSLASVCPALHECFHHHDTDSHAEGQCPVCLFAKGTVDAPEIPPCNAAFSLQLVATISILPQIALPAAHYRLLPERAPPSVLSSRSVAG